MSNSDLLKIRTVVREISKCMDIYDVNNVIEAKLCERDIAILEDIEKKLETFIKRSHLKIVS